MTSYKELELNEVEWWSLWARLEKLNGGYLLYSKEFLEPLFNHAGMFDPSNRTEGFVLAVESLYTSLGVAPSFIVASDNDFYEINTQLTRRGYTLADRLHVMTLEGQLNKHRDDVKVVEADSSQIDLWSSLYVSSFDEDPKLLPTIKRIAASALTHRNVKLIIGYIGGEPGGATALCTTTGVTGAYCVGTLREKRGLGIATTLLSYASRHALSTKTILALQTFESDRVEGFYAKLGFRRAYTKNAWVKHQRSS